MSEDIRGFRRCLSDKTILDRLAEQEEFEKAPRYDPQEVSESCDDSDHKSAKDREIERLNRCLSEIVDILNRANTECLDHYRFKQEEKIVLTGFRRLCDIHAALFKKRSDYEIYGSRIINDLLNSVDLQAQKQAYDQEEIKRIDKAGRESFDSLRELYFAIAEMLGVNNDKEMIAKIKELAEIKAEIALGNIGVLSNLSYEFRSQIKQALYEGVRKDKYPSIDEFPDDDAISFVEHLIDRHKHWGRDHEFTQFALEVKQLLIDSVGKDISNEEAITEIKRLQANQNRFDSATYDPFQDKYKLENIEHAISFRATVASYLGCSYDRSEAIAKIEQLTGAKDREIEKLQAFQSQVMKMLGLDITFREENISITNEDAYMVLQNLLDRWEEFKQLKNESVKDREIEPPSRVYNVHVTTTGNPSKIAEAIQKELLRNESIQEEYEKAPHYDPQENPEVCDDSESAKDREIERLNRCLSGIASFLGLPSDAKQPDICFTIMELKNKNKKYFKDSFQLEVIAKYLGLPSDCKPMDVTAEIIDLKEELDQAKKIIARLVGG